MREDITKSFRRGLSAKATVGSTEEFGSMSFLSGFGKRRSLKRRSSMGSAPAPLSWNPTTRTKEGANKDEEIQKLEKRVLTLEGDVATARSETDAAQQEVKGLEGKVENRDSILRKRAIIIRDQEAQIKAHVEALERLEATVVAQDAETKKLLAQCKEFAQLLDKAEQRAEGLEGELACVRGELAEKEETVFETEKEVSDLKFQHRPKPIRGFVKTLMCAGTGALVALASAGNR